MEKNKEKNHLDRGDYKDYELQILKAYREKYPKMLVLDNFRQIGRISKKKRQIDIGLFTNSPNPKLKCVVECKNLNRKVSLGTIDSFFGFLHDLNIKEGILVTTLGFSEGVENYAKNKGIKLDVLSYEFLKDYCFIPPLEIPDIFMLNVNYNTKYCKRCDNTMLYEVMIVYGMADFEHLYCTKCKHRITKQEIRSDGNHRVIKNFKGKEVSGEQISEVIAKHLWNTREEWDHAHYLSKKELTKLPKDTFCEICHHPFCEHPPTHMMNEYNGKNICSSCFMSNRQLLIDYGYIK